ncbi:MAG: kelch repeat-containing protein, partial [Verrucomicrobiota bacterium]
ELYNPTTGTWTPTGSMNTGREWHTATLLANGKVLVAGGYGTGGDIATTEVYDPSSGMPSGGAMASSFCWALFPLPHHPPPTPALIYTEVWASP